MQLPLFQDVYPVDTAALARCLRAPVVAVDVETQTRWPGRGPHADYGLSYSADITVIALAWRENGEYITTSLAAPFDESVCRFLKTLFQSSAVIVAHNAVFDIRQLSKYTDGIIPNRIWDTQSMARLLHPAVNVSYSLLAVAGALRIDVPERQQAMKSQRGKLHMIPFELTMQYAQDDARLSLEIYQKQQAIPCEPELVDWECRALHEYCLMAVRGMRLNVPLVEKRLAELEKQRDELTTILQADGLPTPSSPKARAKYLYETKSIPLPEWNPKSYYFTRAGRHRLAKLPPGAPVELSDLSTRSDVIESYMEDNSPFREQLKSLSIYMEVDWMISTLKGLVEHADLDGRLHSLVTIATESGRRASSYPHMQNWKMPAMAGVAIGDEGFTLVEIDYSNAENIMAALISGDNNLAAACGAKDFHSTMASQYFGQTWEKAEAPERKHLRNMAKKITYGTAYGMGAARLGESIGVSTDEARRLMRAKDKAFAQVTRTRAAAQREATEKSILKLWTGRKVAVPSAFVAWNFVCQGGVGETLKRAIVVLGETYRARGMRSRVALDMHDALVLEIAHDEWDAAIALASDVMSHITPSQLHERTKPPIQWVAQAKLDENQQKWGFGQPHPPASS